MPRGTHTLTHSQQVPPDVLLGAYDANPNRLASLAGLNLSRSAGLVIPDISDAPVHFASVKSKDGSIDLADSFIKAGLGSVKLWERCNKSIPAFLSAALNEWLKSIGADALEKFSDYHVSFEDSVSEGPVPEGKLLASIDAGSYMKITVGSLLDALEAQKKGLGAALYRVLTSGVGQWVRYFGYDDAQEYIERWIENTESEIEFNEDESFDDACKRLGIKFYPVEEHTPDYLKSSKIGFPAALKLLKDNSNGRFKAVIEDVLEIASLKQKQTFTYQQREDLGFEWDDSPLPCLLINFRAHDAIEQSFDADTENINEVMHEPQWMALFEYANASAVKAILEDIQRFVRVHLAVNRIGIAAARFKDKKINDRTRSSRGTGQLLAA